MVRGIEKREIFTDDDDRVDFLRRLSDVLPDEGIACLAFALMTNHVHLVLRTGPNASISRVMARLGTGHAVRFNRRHERVGHLFQNRFRSDLVADEAHLATLVRYVHLNPLRAGLVASTAALEHYSWTGYAALLGNAACEFLAVQEVLAWFGSDVGSSRRALRHWMDAGVSAEGPDLGAHVERDPSPLPTPRGLEAEIVHDGWDLSGVLAWVCRQTGAWDADVRAGRRTALASEARAISAYLAQRAIGTRPAEMMMLRLTSGAASRAITRGRVLAEKLRLSLPARPDQT
jgi:REP element-mobilizing transposase RayT